jgi:hypothetical protein
MVAQEGNHFHMYLQEAMAMRYILFPYLQKTICRKILDPQFIDGDGKYVKELAVQLTIDREDHPTMRQVELLLDSIESRMQYIMDRVVCKSKSMVLQ